MAFSELTVFLVVCAVLCGAASGEDLCSEYVAVLVNCLPILIEMRPSERTGRLLLV